MGTSELLKTPLTVFLVIVTLVLAFLAAHRIGNKWLRIPVRVTCSIAAVLIGLLLALMLFARGKPTETISETQNGSFKVLVRSQEFHHSGIINVDVCVADSSTMSSPRTRKGNAFFTASIFRGYPSNGYRGAMSRLLLITDE